MDFNKKNRIVNLNFTCDGLKFDAAIDCDWFLHAYETYKNVSNKETPIEIFCYDHPEWDIRMIFFKSDDMTVSVNDQQEDFKSGILHTFCNFDIILNATKEWIKEMTKNDELW